MRIICFGWLNGPLTFDLNALAKLAGCLRSELDSVWPEVLPKLRETKRGFVNRRVEKQRGILRNFRKSRQKAAQTRWQREKSHPLPQPATASAPPLRVNGNPHAKESNLINGADIRRHGQHAWCSWPERDGLCVPVFLHKEFLGKSQKPEAELKAFYVEAVARLNGVAVGEDALVFWRNTFAEWVGTVTATPDTSSKSARIMAGARAVRAKVQKGEPLSVFSPLLAAKRS